jgi:phosphatidylglycerophosphate synthase
MLLHVPDGSRDRRIEDPSNLLIIHPAARSLLPWFIARGISANLVSFGGLCLGTLAALAYADWRVWPFPLIGLLLSIAWLIADGLDGMIARATGSASSFGRLLDGLCDHGVFILIYVALAASIGTLGTWILAICAGVLHALQSNVYESERARFHRRKIGVPATTSAFAANPILRIYDSVWSLVDTIAGRFDERLARDRDSTELGRTYAAQAASPLRLMSLLSANVRILAIFLACIARRPALFWWFEILPLTAVLVIGLCWHRVVETRIIRNSGAPE